MAKKGFLDGYKTYDTSDGYGSPRSWKYWFNRKITMDEAIDILQEDDPYTILNVSFESSIDEIKASYRKLAMQWHPDKNPDNNDYCTEMMKKINAAYHYLSIRHN